MIHVGGRASRQRERLDALARCVVGSDVPHPDEVADGALVALAHRHRVLPVLAGRLVAAGVLAPLPDAVLAHLAAGERADARVVALDAMRVAHEHNTQLLAVLDSLTAALHDAAIPVLALKGAHLLRRGWLPSAAWRSMRDVDLLVSPDDAACATALLGAVGWEAVDLPTLPAAHHGRPLRTAGGIGSVELHTAPITPRWASVLGGDAFVPGLTPADEDVVAHLIVHALGQDDEWSTFVPPLRLLADLSLRTEASGLAPLDWDAVARRFAGSGRMPLLDALTAHAQRCGAPFAADLRGACAASALRRVRAAGHVHAASVLVGLPGLHDRYALARRRVAVLEPERLERRYGAVAASAPRRTALRYVVEHGAVRLVRR